MPGKDKKNQKGQKDQKEQKKQKKVELTPEQKQELERKNYLASLKRVRNITGNGYNLLNQYYGESGTMFDGMEGKEEYDHIFVPEVIGWPDHVITAVVLGAMMDPAYLDRSMTASGFGGGTSNYIEFNQNFLTESILAKDKRTGFFPQVMIYGREKASKALVQMIDKKGTEQVYEYLNNFVQYAVNDVKKCTLYSSHNLANGYDFNGPKYAYCIAAELTATEPFRSHIQISDFDRMKLMAFKHQVDVNAQLVREKITLMEKPPAAGTKEREDAVAELMFKEYLIGTLRQERSEMFNEEETVFAELLDAQGVDPSVPEYESLYSLQDGLSISRIHMHSNVSLNRTTDREVILAGPDGVQKLRDMYMDSIRKSDTFKNLVNAEGTELQDQLIQLDSTAFKGLTALADVPTSGESAEYNRITAGTFGRNNQEIGQRISDMLDGIARRNHLVRAYDQKRLGRNRSRVEGLLNDFTEQETVLPDDKNLREIKTGLTMLVDQASSLEKAGMAEPHNLKAYTNTIDKIMGSIDAFYREHGASGESDQEQNLIRMLRRLKRGLKWNKHGIMEPERSREREQILRENAKTYEKPVQEGIDALVRVRREQYEAEMLDATIARRTLIIRAMNGMTQLGEMIKAGTPLVGKDKTTAIGYLRDILAERIYVKAYSENMNQAVHEPERYAAKIAEKLPEFAALTNKLSMTDIGEIAFEGRADRLLDSLKPEKLSELFEQERDLESQAESDRITREITEQEEAENRRRKLEDREEYRRRVRRQHDEYNAGILRIQSAYGSKGQFAPELELAEEYNALTFDVPEGLDENTVTAIVLGSIMKTERMDHKMTTSSVGIGGMSITLTSFNRTFLVENLGTEDPDFARQGTFALAMVEGRKEAIQAIEAYKKGNLEPAKAMLRTFLEFTQDSLRLSRAVSSTELNSLITSNQQAAIIQLGTEMIGKPPFSVTIEDSEIAMNKGLAYEQTMQNVYRVFEDKRDIMLKPKAPGSEERIREIEELMFREYLLSTLSVAIEEKQRMGRIYIDKLRQEYGYDHAYNRAEARKYSDVNSEYETKLSWNFNEYLTTDHEVLLSTEKGVETLRELYMPEIRKTELYRKMISAEGTDYEDLFPQLDEAASEGLQSFKNVKVPPAAKGINDRNRKLFEEKNRELEAEINRGVQQLIRKEMELTEYSKKALEGSANVAEYAKDQLDPEKLKDKEVSVGMRKNLSTLRTSLSTFFRMADKMADEKTAVTEKDLQQFAEYGRYVEKICVDYLSKHTEKARSEADQRVLRHVRRVRNVVKADSVLMLELYQEKQRKDRMEEARGMRDPEKAKEFVGTHKDVKPGDPEFIYGTLSEKGLRQLSVAVREEMILSKSGKSDNRKVMIDKAATAVKALTEMICKGEAYVAQHQEEAGKYLKDIMGERVLKVVEEFKIPCSEPDRYMGNVVDKIPEMRRLLKKITIGTIGKIAFDGHTDQLLTGYRKELDDSLGMEGKLRTWVDEVYLAKANQEMKEITARKKRVNDNKNEINLEEEVIQRKEDEKFRINIDIKGDKNKDRIIIHDPEEDNKNEINLEPEEENHNIIMPEKPKPEDKSMRRLKRDVPSPVPPKKKVPKAPVSKADDPEKALKVPKEEPKGAPKDDPKVAPKEEQPGRIKILNDELIEPMIPVPFDELRNDPAMEEEHSAIIDAGDGSELLGDDENNMGMIQEEPQENPLVDPDAPDYNLSLSRAAMENPEIPEDNNIIVNPVSALDYIENIRDHQFKVVNTSYLTEEILNDYGDKFLRIMAARQLADSARNKSGRLESCILSEQQIEDRVALMKNDEIFRGFIEDIKNSRYKQITAINGAKMRPGHGGKLDDMMKEYMLSLPPGKLKNSKLHERYMPTVGQRIESIQDQMKKLNKTRPANDEEEERKDHQLSCAVAEILELRNLAKAEAGKKDRLSKNIPCSRDDTLKRRIDYYADRDSFRWTALHRDVQRLALKGHGGQMTLKAREVDAERPGRDQAPCEIITANSIEARMKRLEGKAGTLVQDLRGAEDGSLEQQQLVQNGNKLLKEYALLLAKVSDPEYYEVKPDMLRNDVPWDKIRELRTTETEFTRRFDRTFSHFNPGEIADCLDIMTASNVSTFKNSINAKINQVSARLNGGHHPANPQANQQANPQRGRNVGGRGK